MRTVSACFNANEILESATEKIFLMKFKRL